MASDTFNRADGGLGANWTDLHAGLQISGNQVVATSASANNSAYYAAYTPPDNQVARLRFVADGDGGPMVRASAGPNFYIGVARTSGMQIQKCVSGSFSTLGTWAGVSVGGIVRLEAEGSTIRLYYDDVLVGSVTDTDLTSGFGGIYNFNTSGAYDDFSIEPLAGAAVMGFGQLTGRHLRPYLFSR